MSNDTRDIIRTGYVVMLILVAVAILPLFSFIVVASVYNWWNFDLSEPILVVMRWLLGLTSGIGIIIVFYNSVKMYKTLTGI